ncbi:hypothetical protein OF117_17260 [Geodermatophilus sp. YIM 151500]|uniref:hypothetical protein n=1 Tax=Geodermatophilus sp. YIM 151500 TaxID=2984531 RepID=UPI0021E40AD2|nr:hypothetical protein [Geodermatophilus sp. YIM 151500]MCV2491102.1 hypothetical protein [Geodermatophilus sp. YIM 151500]
MPEGPGVGAARGLVVVAAAAAALVWVLPAPAARAVDDPSRPDARVTHGPSCRPGGVVVEVVGGSAAYGVVLTTTRVPRGEDAVELAPGQSAVLRTGEVAWGETLDGALEFTARDGSGVRYVDDLDGYRFTRPAEADCAAITAPPPAGGGTGDAPPAADALGPQPAVLRSAPVAAGSPTELGPVLAAAASLGASLCGWVAVAGRQRATRCRPAGSAAERIGGR